jgi:hypothetical protein
MSDHVISKSTPEVPADSGTPPAPPPGPPRWSRWVAVLALALALLAIALAARSLLHPLKASTTAPVTDRQIAEAKTRACTAYSTVRSAVSLQFHRSAVSLRPGSDLGGDYSAAQAAAANARLSMTFGSAYLLARLDPATPPPLAAAIRSYADHLQDIAMISLAGDANADPAQAAADQAGRLSDAEATAARVADLCK